MRLGADITLCYGLETGYETCTPQQIVNNLYDRTNLYNTRELTGLTPTPIANITDDSIAAVISPQVHDNLFYLHDPS
jgi:cell division protein YceG involved in septum cleavage